MQTPNQPLTPEQGEKLKELGLYLHEVRRKRALSTEALAKQTRIPLRLIKAIETADGSALPEPIYIQALVRRIANALHLNGQELAAAFPVETHWQSIRPTWKPVSASQLRPFHMYLVYIAVLIGAVSGLSILIKPPGPQLAKDNSSVSLESPSVSSAPVQQVQNISSPPPVQAPPSQQTEAQISNDRVVVSMTLQDDCWLRVVADGEVAFEGTLPKGEKRSWEAKEQITIMAGNAGGVVVAINNEEARPLGNPGAVQTVTYRPPSGDQS
ncbi:RodZ domain-containing protein [Spirulina sp. CCNP1310]|uniref:RodZ domain-containing protein n=1 Tax=Spirulina sp. CCNP1310 TaxID=3110249 RepID=UPI002B2089E6|nr:RodZ domain-containing protein [Spirulina sp. CCNP1310]MEA5418194.1 RodZ domain-containing protein [Spirulina sp. CCNP1310]